MKYIKKLFFVFILFAAACSQGENENNLVAKLETSNKPNKTHESHIVENNQLLLFFINPNGRPCQIQDSILDEIKPQLSGSADIVYIKTTDPASREVFYKFGIRSLPNLIITDLKGNIKKRFPPGIQNKQVILSSLGL